MAKTAVKIVQQCQDWFRIDERIKAEHIKRAEESYQFYTGIRQWDPQVVAKLALEGRPALTINRILSIVNTLSGYQRRNRSDIKLYPRRGGSAPVAHLGTELIKHTMDISGGVFELSDCFLDGIVCGIGWIMADRVYTEDVIHGDLIIRKESPFDIVEDQTNRAYDVNKGMRICKTFWWDKRQIELQYPKKTQGLKEAMDSPAWAADRQVPFENEALDYEPDTGVFKVQPGGDESFRELKYLIREYWYKEWVSAVFLVHPATLSIQRLAAGDVKKAREALVTRPDLAGHFRIVERPAPLMHRAVMVGDVLLEHEEDPLRGLTKFPFFRFCPYWADGYPFGLVDNIKQPQMELNKRRSQTLHNANTTANAGWICDYIVGDYDQVIETYGSKPGVVLDRSKAPGLEKIQPSKLDVAHFKLSLQAGEDMKDISGINSDLLATRPGSSESGRARIVRQEAGLTISEITFDNFNRTQGDVGYFLWEIIRATDIYSEQEIASIVQEGQLSDFMKDGKLDLSPMRDWRLGRYGVRVGRSVNSVTVRQGHFDQMLEAAKAGLPIPPQVIVEMSDWPNKEDILEKMKQMQQQQEQALVTQGARA